ncbi:TonB C-terminal domain-containing protein [Paracoccus alkanivorans]|nr:TonB C-terminal domain-containing protein [Paracoccus alkanivorans]
MKYLFIVLLACAWPGVSAAQALISPDGKTLLIGNKRGWYELQGPYIAHFAQPSKTVRKNGPWGKFHVVVGFTAADTGDISQLKILESSGNETADSQVLGALDGLKLLPFTADMKEAELKLVLPVTWVNDPLPVTKPAE